SRPSSPSARFTRGARSAPIPTLRCRYDRQNDTRRPPPNAFSKKLENHAAMVALYFMFYNWPCSSGPFVTRGEFLVTLVDVREIIGLVLLFIVVFSLSTKAGWHLRQSVGDAPHCLD